MSVEKIKLESGQELEQMITKEIDQVEKNLTVVCNDVPINDKTTLDTLCHDESGQLVVLKVSVEEDDNMLLQGIQSLDYVDKFKSFLKMTYSKHKIDDQEKPRLILIAPSFSETMLHTVQHMQGLRIELYEWEYLKIGDHKALRLQSIFVPNPTSRPERLKEEAELKTSNERKHESRSKKKEVAAEKKEEMIQQPELPPSEPEAPKEEFSWNPEPSTEAQPEQKEETPPEPTKEEAPKRKLRLF